MPKEGKKKKTLALMFKKCLKRKDLSFTNEEIKKISIKTKFKNHHDATHIDKRTKMPKIMLDKDYFIVHTGKGKHKFIKGIDKGFHKFEKVTSERVVDDRYESGIVDKLNESEANILSVAYNQRIISDFLYHYSVIPKIYNAHRSKKSFKYNVGKESVEAESQQIEIDLTIEHSDEVTIFEAKNGFQSEFAVYQIYLPFLYYYERNKTENLGIKKINCCYLLRKKVGDVSYTRIYQYDFTDPYDMTSIKFIKSKEYKI